MTTIRANCMDCGEVQLRGDDLKLVHETGRDTYFYNFQCPEDGRITLKEASKRIADLLISSDVKVYPVNFGEELINEGLPYDSFSKGPVTQDELIDFHLDLVKADPSEIIEFAESGR